MTPENFTYWLQGWFELNDTIDHREGASPETLQVIKDHLKLVFDKQTPDRKKVEENWVGDNDELKMSEESKIDIDKLSKEIEKYNNNHPWNYPNVQKDDTIKPSWPTYPTIICSNMSQEEWKNQHESDFSSSFKSDKAC